MVCIAQIFKVKDDGRECVNYRGISMLSIPGKIYERVLISIRMESKKEHVV